MAEPKEKAPQLDPATAALVAAAVAQAMAPVIEAIRKPVKTEKEIEAERQALADQLQLRATMLAREKKRLQDQIDCSHMQPKGGDAATVYVYANGGPSDYLICQHCHKSIYPQSLPALGITGEPELYNKLIEHTNGIG